MPTSLVLTGSPPSRPVARRRGPIRACLPVLVMLLALAGCATPASEGLDRLSALQRRLLDWHSRADTGPNARQARMSPARSPMPLARAEPPSPITWQWEGRTLTLDDYRRRQPVAALLIAKDGRILHESYQFGLDAQRHFLSNSIAKSVTSLAIGLALQEGRITDLRTPAVRYVPQLDGSLYGETSLRDLLRMGSGARFVETYRPGDDSTRFRQTFQRLGVLAALREFGERAAPAGTRFNYAGPDVAVLAAVIRGATGESVADYLDGRLWQAMGAQAAARWDRDITGLELTQCCIRAVPRDYLRLGIVLAHDGRRPDTGTVVIPRDYLVESTRSDRLDPPFRPTGTGRGIGYNNLFWIQAGVQRRFALLGVHGQAIFVDPGLRLVMVHLAVNESANAGDTSMAAERAALWRGVVQSVGAW